MLRMLLCLGIVGCSAFVGLYYSARLTKRRDTLNSIAELLDRAAVRMSYSSGDLCEIFSDNFARFKFVRDKPFDEYWSAFVKAISQPLKKDDIILLRNFINGLGVTDNDSQQRHIRLYTELLREKSVQAQREIDERSKLYRVLPISLGLMISILII